MSTESMASGVVGVAPKRWMVWTGRVLSVLPILMMALSGIGKLTHAPQLVEAFVNKFGYPESSMTLIGLLEFTCAVICARPAYLGARRDSTCRLLRWRGGHTCAGG